MKPIEEVIVWFVFLALLLSFVIYLYLSLQLGLPLITIPYLSMIFSLLVYFFYQLIK